MLNNNAHCIKPHMGFAFLIKCSLNITPFFLFTLLMFVLCFVPYLTPLHYSLFSLCVLLLFAPCFILLCCSFVGSHCWFIIGIASSLC